MYTATTWLVVSLDMKEFLKKKMANWCWRDGPVVKKIIAILLDHKGSNPNIHILAHNHLTPVLEDPKPPSSFLQASGTHVVHIHIMQAKHLHKINPIARNHGSHFYMDLQSISPQARCGGTCL